MLAPAHPVHRLDGLRYRRHFPAACAAGQRRGRCERLSERWCRASWQPTPATVRLPARFGPEPGTSPGHASSASARSRRAPTHAQHHIGVPLDQRGERDLVVLAGEAAEQFTIGRGGLISHRGRPNTVRSTAERFSLMAPALALTVSPRTSCAPAGRYLHFFGFKSPEASVFSPAFTVTPVFSCSSSPRPSSQR